MGLEEGEGRKDLRQQNTSCYLCTQILLLCHQQKYILLHLSLFSLHLLCDEAMRCSQSLILALADLGVSGAFLGS